MPRPPGTYEATDPYRVSAASEWQTFIDFVTSRINTVTGVAYKDDPTIAVISLAGEPEPPNTQECGKATDTATLTEFYRRTLAMLASQTRTTCTRRVASGRPTGSTSALAVAVPASTAARSSRSPTTPCPRCTRTRRVGVEPNGTPIDFQAQELGAYANEPRQALVHGGIRLEAGHRRREAGLLSHVAQRGAGGVWLGRYLFWNLGPQTAGGSHDVNPGTPLAWAAVRGPLGAWTPAADMSVRRVFMPVVALPDERVLVIGGQSSTGYTADVTVVRSHDEHLDRGRAIVHCS